MKTAVSKLREAYGTFRAKFYTTMETVFYTGTEGSEKKLNRRVLILFILLCLSIGIVLYTVLHLFVEPSDERWLNF